MQKTINLETKFSALKSESAHKRFSVCFVDQNGQTSPFQKVGLLEKDGLFCRLKRAKCSASSPQAELNLFIL